MQITKAVWVRYAVLVCLSSCLGLATDDAAVDGAYRIECKGVAGTFKITHEGVREIRLNGKKLADTELGASLRHGFIGSYEIDLDGLGVGKSIRLFFLFDEADRVRAITGFYLRTSAMAGKENDPFVAEACALKVDRLGSRAR